MMTGCCACPWRSAALRSKGLMAAARNRFMTFKPRIYTDETRIELPSPQSSPKGRGRKTPQKLLVLIRVIRGSRSYLICEDLCASAAKHSGINRALLLLDHDRPRHLRVNRAKIG